MASISALKNKQTNKKPPKKLLFLVATGLDTAENEMQSLTVCWFMLIVKYIASSWSPLQRVVKTEIALFLILQEKHSVTKHVTVRIFVDVLYQAEDITEFSKWLVINYSQMIVLYQLIWSSCFSSLNSYHGRLHWLIFKYETSFALPE